MPDSALLDKVRKVNKLQTTSQTGTCLYQKHFFMKNIHNAMGYLLLVRKIDQFSGFPTTLLGSIAIQ